MMHVGFTGTRQGLTEAQDATLRHVLQDLALESEFDTTLHHGDCIGADKHVHRLAYQLGWRLVVHPPVDARYRAWCNYGDEGHYAPSTVVRQGKPYIERNHDIVDECDVVIACPRSDSEVLRSGTWATMRYTRKRDKRLIVVLPDGRRWCPIRLDLVNGGGTDEHGGRGNR